MKHLLSLTLLFALSLLNSGCGIIPIVKEITELRGEMQQLKKLEGYTVLVESTISDKGLRVALVPTVCIVTKNGQKGVLVVGENYEPLFQKVELGKSEGNRTEVLSGIKEKDRIFIDIPPWF
tara:strand:- start:103 stop:468 length:366 start_codon:yes stop_codon:yes gene_type:complete